MRRLPIAVLLLLAAGAHVTWCIRYACATILAARDTPPALRRSVQLTPANAAYYARLATVDPDNAPHWLASALQLHPTDSVLWIERGIEQEVSGHTAAAEASLLEATRRDRQYIPRWTLAAFYFRQRDVPKFQAAARQALEMAWGDALPLFQMAAQLGLSLDDVRRNMLPDRAPVLAAFVSECLHRNNYDETVRTARRLVEIGASEYRPTVLAAVDELFQAHRSAESVALWNQMAAAHWIPEPAISSAALIPNREFAFEFLPAGFDWRPSTLDGVVVWRLGRGRGLQLEFSGREPESCTLLTLPLPLDPTRTYTFQVQASGLAPGAGLKWKLGGQEWEAASNLKAELKSPALPLTLVYNRALGTKRVEGTLTIYSATVSIAP